MEIYFVASLSFTFSGRVFAMHRTVDVFNCFVFFGQQRYWLLKLLWKSLSIYSLVHLPSELLNDHHLSICTFTAYIYHYHLSTTSISIFILHFLGKNKKQKCQTKYCIYSLCSTFSIIPSRALLRLTLGFYQGIKVWTYSLFLTMLKKINLLRCQTQYCMSILLPDISDCCAFALLRASE